MEIVVLMMRLPALLDAQLQRDADLTHFEYGVMSSLSTAPDRTLRMSALADFTSASLSRLSHVVSRLERHRRCRSSSSAATARVAPPTRR